MQARDKPWYINRPLSSVATRRRTTREITIEINEKEEKVGILVVNQWPKTDKRVVKARGKDLWAGRSLTGLAGRW